MMSGITICNIFDAPKHGLDKLKIVIVKVHQNQNFLSSRDPLVFSSLYFKEALCTIDDTGTLYVKKLKYIAVYFVTSA